MSLTLSFLEVTLLWSNIQSPSQKWRLVGWTLNIWLCFKTIKNIIDVKMIVTCINDSRLHKYERGRIFCYKNVMEVIWYIHISLQLFNNIIIYSEKTVAIWLLPSAFSFLEVTEYWTSYGCCLYTINNISSNLLGEITDYLERF